MEAEEKKAKLEGIAKSVFEMVYVQSALAEIDDVTMIICLINSDANTILIDGDNRAVLNGAETVVSGVVDYLLQKADDLAHKHRGDE